MINYKMFSGKKINAVMHAINLLTVLSNLIINNSESKTDNLCRVAVYTATFVALIMHMKLFLVCMPSIP